MMPVYRILSLDGGGQLALTSTLLLGEIEKRRPGFLANTDMIAGTSAGAMVGLILATQDDPAPLLPYTDRLWEEFFLLSMNSLVGTMLGIVGLGALFTHERLEQYLAQEELLGTKTLGDLRKKVVITSFKLDGFDKRTGARTWKPKIFHNDADSDEPDLKEKAVEVALRSSASPIFFPIVDGFVDGGVVANHPALVAISQVCHDWREDHKSKASSLRHMNDLRVLSIGVGEDQKYVATEDANWGYFNWLLNPLNPLLAVNALLRGDSMGVDYQCYNILPEGNYCRLNPYYVRNSPIPFMVSTRDIKRTVQSPETQHMIDCTVDWLDSSGWFEKS